MIDPEWLDAALNPPRAHGPSLGQGRIRVEAEDFVVEEDLGFEASGAGQHLLLKVRKRDANTEWVARSLARIAGCRPHDVGFAGLKDRRAVAIQWFTVPRTATGLDAWTQASIEGCEVLEAHEHSRKLPRGALAGNRFTIRIRELKPSASAPDALAERIEAIRLRGVPNYFGPQRFGRDAGNLAQIERGARALGPRERGFVLSAARSLVFNAVLAERVRDGSWDRLEVGDVANLDGRGSIFPVTALDPDIVERNARLDLHPTGPLWGSDAPLSAGRICELEQRIADAYKAPASLTIDAGMHQERRSLRMPVRDLSIQQDDGDWIVRFRLGKGSFATTVLRELVDLAPSDEGEGEA
jgi:tRNA pseudouridine13 synthase